MNAWTEQSNFSRGELDPQLYMRSDVEHYYSGAKELTNVFVLPQGGVQRRPGTLYRATLPAKSRLAAFEFAADDNYIVALSALAATVYQPDGTVVITLVTPYTEANLFDDLRPVQWIQAADTMVVVHPDHQPRELVRNIASSGSLGADPFATAAAGAGTTTMTVTDANHGLVTGQTVVFTGAVGFDGVSTADLNDSAGFTITRVDEDTYTFTVDTTGSAGASGGGSSITFAAAELWQFNTITLLNIPLFNFADGLTPDVTDEVQDLQFVNTWAGGDRFKLTLGTQTTSDIDYSTNTNTQEENIRAALQALSNTGTSGITVAYQSGTTYRITFSGDDGDFDWDELVAILSSVAGNGTISISTVVDGASGGENVWSSTRGWPQSVALHEERLVFGGAKSLPSRVWASKTTDQYDFDTGDSLASDGIEAKMGTENLNSVAHVVSNRHLQVLTSGAELYTPERPLKPDNVGFVAQTRRGCNAVRPVGIDGATLFVQRDGLAVRQWVYQDIEQAYTDDDITILSRHMFDSPQDMDVLKGALGDYVLVTNATSGEICCLTINRAQGIMAWSRWQTRAGDKFVTTAVISGSTQNQIAYACAERSVGGSTVYCLEEFSSTTYTDCAEQSTSADQLAARSLVSGTDLDWYGWGHLAGVLDVCVRADDAPRPHVDIDGSGHFAVGGDFDTLEAGLCFSVAIETMPVVVNTQSGRLTLRKKAIRRAAVDMIDSYGVKVNDYPVESPTPFPSFDDDVELVTGVREVRLRGHSERPTVRITQDDPMPLNLRGIEMEVRAYG